MQRSKINYRTYHFISGRAQFLNYCKHAWKFLASILRRPRAVSDYPRCFTEGAEEGLSQHVLLTRAQFRTRKAFVCKYSVINDWLATATSSAWLVTAGLLVRRQLPGRLTLLLAVHNTQLRVRAAVVVAATGSECPPCVYMCLRVSFFLFLAALVKFPDPKHVGCDSFKSPLLWMF